MNNAINEIKNTLEATNSRIMEADALSSEPPGKPVMIVKMIQNLEIKMESQIA